MAPQRSIKKLRITQNITSKTIFSAICREMHENKWHRACLLYAPNWEPIGQYLGVSKVTPLFSLLPSLSHGPTSTPTSPPSTPPSHTASTSFSPSNPNNNTHHPLPPNTSAFHPPPPTHHRKTAPHCPKIPPNKFSRSATTWTEKGWGTTSGTI